LVRSRPTTLKGLLLDDRFVAGLGDVYSDEVLFASGMRYDRPTRSVSSSDVRRLYRGLMEVLQDAVKARGFTLGEHDFRDLYGRPGGYQNERKVFEREGGRCIRCKHAVAKTGLAGGDLGVRVTYFCPQCQT
jgi:formamidopyrimidine-DNA glycosylase